MSDYFNGYSVPFQYPTPPVDPRQEERKGLRSAASFVGALMLALTVTMQFTYTLVALALIFTGFLSLDALMKEQLGLDNTTYLLIYACVYILAMGLPLLLVIGRRRLFADRFPKKPLTVGVGLLGILGAVGICMGANIVTSYLISLLEQWNVPVPEMPDMMESTPTSLLLNLFVVAVLPAILEEALFRGCVLRVLRPYGDFFAVFVSSVLFGLMHGNVRQIPFALIVGLALGWLYVVTNSIFLPMVVHFANNALSVVMEYLAFYLPENSVNYFYGFIIYALAVIGAVALIVLLFVGRSHLKATPNGCGLRTGERFRTLLSSPAFVISVVVFVGLTCWEWIA